VSRKDDPCQQIVVISDLHSGCQMALCPPTGARLDSGNIYIPKPDGPQARLWPIWLDFNRWVGQVTSGKSFDLVVNGDAIDGVHHGSTSQFSHNLNDQIRLAEEILRPLVQKARRYYHIRGTEAHVGKEATDEERLAKNLGAVPDDQGQYARYALWKRMGGPKGPLVHLLHHVGTTGSSAYEATAVYKELVESYVEAGRWGDEPPQAIVRSHRHRYLETKIGSAKGYAFAVVTPAWQGKTTFAYKVAGARQSESQFGGIVLKIGDEDGLYSRAFIRRNERPRVEEG
jgi:hypothetical protein